MATDEIEVVVAAEGVAPRQPVDQHRRDEVVAGVDAPSIAWFEVIIFWVLMTPLGEPVEPEVNSSFATVSGSTFACAASTCVAGGFREHASKGVEGHSAAD